MTFFKLLTNMNFQKLVQSDHKYFIQEVYHCDLHFWYNGPFVIHIFIPGNSFKNPKDELQSFFCDVLIQTQGIVSVIGNVCKSCLLILTLERRFPTQSEKDIEINVLFD